MTQKEDATPCRRRWQVTISFENTCLHTFCLLDVLNTNNNGCGYLHMCMYIYIYRVILHDVQLEMSLPVRRYSPGKDNIVNAIVLCACPASSVLLVQHVVRQADWYGRDFPSSFTISPLPPPNTTGTTWRLQGLARGAQGHRPRVVCH